ncbi:MarR family EPS-associated transcriptional regulator [Marinagarivorans algicola]|uniref:MarR family EPS-associated transcriptional regulator n=1 Tax=Marinagarivorans algicola TaxID=1513270 RepID=UPI00373584D4
MKETAIPDEVRLALMRKLAQNPNVSQRELAAELGVSLGKVNYCLKALVKVGWVKAGNFARSNNKAGYAYLLTPKGITEKAELTTRFIERKQQQYDSLKKEIEELKAEARQ